MKSQFELDGRDRRLACRVSPRRAGGQAAENSYPVLVAGYAAFQGLKPGVDWIGLLAWLMPCRCYKDLFGVGLFRSL